ncbi:MAG: serine protease [Planctomycetota bacterium]|nr:serine protease [Planctomycetota bacterium]
MGVSEARKAMIEGSALHCGDFVVCFIHKTVGQPPRKGGTGVLLQVADEFFLLTAEHVVSSYREGPSDRFLYLGGGLAEQSKAATEIESAGVLCRSDPHDIAVIRLSNDTVNMLRPDKQFLTLDCVDLHDPQAQGSEYLVLGFPTDPAWGIWNGTTREIQATFLPFGSVPYPGTTSHLINYDPLIHFALHYPKEDIWDNFGNEASLPHPDGISGSAIWRIRRKTTPMDKWVKQEISLVGIEHAFYSEARIIKVTKIGYAIQMIYAEFAHLRQMIDDAFPGEDWTAY